MLAAVAVNGHNVLHHHHHHHDRHLCPHPKRGGARVPKNLAPKIRFVIAAGPSCVVVGVRWYGAPRPTLGDTHTGCRNSYGSDDTILVWFEEAFWIYVTSMNLSQKKSNFVHSDLNLPNCVWCEKINVFKHVTFIIIRCQRSGSDVVA